MRSSGGHVRQKKEDCGYITYLEVPIFARTELVPPGLRTLKGNIGVCTSLRRLSEKTAKNALAV